MILRLEKLSILYVTFCRYRYFTNAETSTQGKDALSAEAMKMEEVMRKTRGTGSEPAEGTSSTSEPARGASFTSEPTKKTSWVEATRKSKLGSIFDEILEESAPGPESTTTNVRVEVQTYFSEPTIPRSDNPLLYWKINQPRLPSLAVTANKYLCAPSTSVESGRLFSTASIINDERRSRLTAEKAEMLISEEESAPHVEVTK